LGKTIFWQANKSSFYNDFNYTHTHLSHYLKAKPVSEIEKL